MADCTRYGFTSVDLSHEWRTASMLACARCAPGVGCAIGPRLPERARPVRGGRAGRPADGLPMTYTAIMDAATPALSCDTLYRIGCQCCPQCGPCGENGSLCSSGSSGTPCSPASHSWGCMISLRSHVPAAIRTRSHAPAHTRHPQVYTAYLHQHLTPAHAARNQLVIGTGKAYSRSQPQRLGSTGRLEIKRGPKKERPRWRPARLVVLRLFCVRA